MTLPVAGQEFACSGCGDCCRGFARDAPDWEPQQGPVFRLTDEPGLPLMSWEWQRMRRLAEARGHALPAEPFDAVLDAAGRRAVVLSYRLVADACPFLEERADLPLGPRSERWGYASGGACGIYPHRPLACRAYPLVPMRNGVALSLHCPDLVDADEASAASMRAAYGGAYDAAVSFRAAPTMVEHVLRRLAEAGAVRLMPEAFDLDHEERMAWPRVDLCDLAEQHGVDTWEGLEARVRAP